MSEGTCESSNGTVEMIAERWHLTPTVGGAPAMLVTEDGRQVDVAISDVRVLDSDPASGPREAYRLIVLNADRSQEKGGLLAGLKSMFGR
jgi:hypothetical protein